MQPSPRAETSRPLFPSLRFCIWLSFGTVSLISSLGSRAVKTVSQSFLFIASFSDSVDPRTDLRSDCVRNAPRHRMEALLRGNPDLALSGLRDRVHHYWYGAGGIGRRKLVLLPRQFFSVHEELNADVRRFLNRFVGIHHEVHQGLGGGFQRSAEH